MGDGVVYAMTKKKQHITRNIDVSVLDYCDFLTHFISNYFVFLFSLSLP